MSKTASHNSNHSLHLVQQRWAKSQGRVCLGEIPIEDLAARHGTPCYLYDQGVMLRQLTALRTALTSRFDVYYSIKANPNQEILKFFVQQGCGLEIASSGELHQALQANCPGESILFAGPGKQDEELAAALQAQVGEIHIESLAEARRLSQLAQTLQKKPRVAIRVNPASAAQGGAMRMGGKATPFGIDEEELDAAVTQIDSDPHLQLVGVHLFSGTQILDHQVLMTQYRHAASIARRVAKLVNSPLATIDFGGGLGIPYFAHETSLDLNALQNEIESFVAEIQNDPLLSSARLLVEPGRFLVGESGIYLTRVIDVKVSRGKKFVIVDGGMHHHLAASGNLGQTIKRNYPVALLDSRNGAETEEVDVVGPLCTPLDVLARRVTLPVAEVGDLFAVFQSGAYARSASPLGFLSHLAPPEVLVDGANERVIRRRGEISDSLRDQLTANDESPPEVSSW